MAVLEFINYTPMRDQITKGKLEWVNCHNQHALAGLPQIFWDDNSPWDEVNHFALTKATGTKGNDIKTIKSLMKHLVAYASWLESKGLSWRHFPIRKSERVIVLYRNHLIAERTKGNLAPSTVQSRMAAVIQFYRHAWVFNFVQRASPLWTDSKVVISFFDAAGFERSITRASSDLAISNRSVHGLRLEDGLLPLRIDDAVSLLGFCREEKLRELFLILSIGFFSGARIQTITSLGVKDVESAYPDLHVPGMYRLRVGPGTDVKTKLSVSGELIIPKMLIDELKEYSSSNERLKRTGRASEQNRRLLFLTTRGNPYESASFNRLMTDLRRRAVRKGLRFMETFKFHQTRATFGTSTMEVLLRCTDVKTAIAFLRAAMLHRHEKTTLGYVRLIQEIPVKRKFAGEFNKAFSGMTDRKWKDYHA